MKNYSYNIFKMTDASGDHIISLNVMRDEQIKIDECKFDYSFCNIRRDLIAESFEAQRLIRFLPAAMRGEATDTIEHFDFRSCLTMARNADRTVYLDDYI